MIDHEASMRQQLDSMSEQLRFTLDQLYDAIEARQKLRAHALGWIEAVERIDPELASVMRTGLEACAAERERRAAKEPSPPPQAPE